MTPQNHFKEAMKTLLTMFEEGIIEKVAHAVYKGGDQGAGVTGNLNMRIFVPLKSLMDTYSENKAR